MSGYVLFQMLDPLRQSLMKGHSFYVEQARKRLLSQFENIESEADHAAKEWLDKSEKYFNPDRHDPGDFYEKASDIGIEFYELLSDMHEQTRLSVVAGMFHEWDKKLRNWLAREIQHWHSGDNVTLKVWSADFSQIADLLESLGWKIRSADYFDMLDACRLVVNVYKHGKGKSFDDIRARFPEYLDDPFKSIDDQLSDFKYLDHTYLKISDGQFQAFSEAILAFWRDVPENVYGSEVTDVPDWFGKALLKERAEETGACARKQA